MRTSRQNLTVCIAMAALFLPAAAQASFGDETIKAFQTFVRWALSFGVGSSVLSFARVGYTYQWSDHPELTMTRLKHAVVGSMLIFGAIAIAIGLAAIYSQKGL